VLAPSWMIVRNFLRWGRPAVVVAVLAAVTWRLGSGPFLDGVRAINAGALAAAAAIFLLTTFCAAWRWRIVAGGLGVDVPPGAATAAYYRCLFLNLTLPGGVAGDVHRGVRHGQDVKDVSHALRAVVWERTAGQVVQVALTVAVLLVLPSPLRPAMPFVAAVLAATAVVVVLVLRGRTQGGRSRLDRARNAAMSDIHSGLLNKKALPAIVLLSTVAVLGHVLTFVIAAHAVGVSAPVSRMLPLAFIAMMAMTLPNIGGWGPREGITAWTFSAAGLGAERGAATAVAYGVMVLAASLPGGLVLVLEWFARRRVAAPQAPRVVAETRVAR
jgi:glycosyltransferase 2 family protein